MSSVSVDKKKIGILWWAGKSIQKACDKHFIPLACIDGLEAHAASRSIVAALTQNRHAYVCKDRPLPIAVSFTAAFLKLFTFLTFGVIEAYKVRKWVHISGQSKTAALDLEEVVFPWPGSAASGHCASPETQPLTVIFGSWSSIVPFLNDPVMQPHSTH